MPRSATAGTQPGNVGRLAGLAVRRTISGSDITSRAGRQLEPGDRSQTVTVNSLADRHGQVVPDLASVALVVEERKIRWTVVDCACAHARQAGQRSLPVVLDGRRWRLAGLDNPADSETDAAWYAVSEDLYDLVAERIWGWGLEPVIHRLAGRTAAEMIDGWDSRPDVLVAGHPGRLSWPSRKLIRQLRRRDWLVTLVR
jgi:hypothetical protein